MSRKKYDFSGWATRNDIKCADGLTIRQDAFADCDGITVPLVYMHDHKEVDNVLGHALLENRDEGVYCYGSFNDTEKGEMAKALVAHGDITSLSIFANQLVKKGTDVSDIPSSKDGVPIRVIEGEEKDVPEVVEE